MHVCGVRVHVGVYVGTDIHAWELEGGGTGIRVCVWVQANTCACWSVRVGISWAARTCIGTGAYTWVPGWV